MKWVVLILCHFTACVAWDGIPWCQTGHCRVVIINCDFPLSLSPSPVPAFPQGQGRSQGERLAGGIKLYVAAQEFSPKPGWSSSKEGVTAPREVGERGREWVRPEVEKERVKKIIVSDLGTHFCISSEAS